MLIDKEKMSKSLGNFLTARAALEKLPARAIRFFMLSAHYRSPINFSEESLLQAKSAMDRLDNCWSDLGHAIANRMKGERKEGNETAALFPPSRKKFRDVWDDDSTPPPPSGVLFDGVKAVNTYLKDTEIWICRARGAGNLLQQLDSVLGILPAEAAGGRWRIRGILKTSLRERNEARKKKDFRRSDEIRDELAARGIVLEDTPTERSGKKKGVDVTGRDRFRPFSFSVRGEAPGECPGSSMQ